MYSKYTCSVPKMVYMTIVPRSGQDFNIEWYWGRRLRGGNPVNTKAALVLFGGRFVEKLEYCVEVNSIDYLGIPGNPQHPKEDSSEKRKFLADLYFNGYDFLTFKYDTTNSLQYMRYCRESSWVFDGFNFLRTQYGSPRNVFGFGFSAGACAIGYETTRPGIENEALAVMVASPQVHYGPLRIEDAVNDRICDAFIEPTSEDYKAWVLEYFNRKPSAFNSRPIHKEWHWWEVGHDPFPNKDDATHRLTVSDVTVKWFENEYSRHP